MRVHHSRREGSGDRDAILAAHIWERRRAEFQRDLDRCWEMRRCWRRGKRRLLAGLALVAVGWWAPFPVGLVVVMWGGGCLGCVVLEGVQWLSLRMGRGRR